MVRLSSIMRDPAGKEIPLTEAQIQEFWSCPNGNPHNWLFRRSPTGEGLYRCYGCGCTVEKRDLKRVTDQI